MFEMNSYLLAIAIISVVYTAYQGIREVIQFVTKKDTFPQPAFVIIDFVADQVQLTLFFFFFFFFHGCKDRKLKL